jgi:hypothetical protein
MKLPFWSETLGDSATRHADAAEAAGNLVGALDPLIMGAVAYERQHEPDKAKTAWARCSGLADRLRASVGVVR